MTTPDPVPRRPLGVRGLALLCCGPLLVAGGFRFGYPDLTVLGVVAFALVPLAAGYALSRPNIGVTRTATPDRVTRGEPVTATLVITNRGRLPVTATAHDRCGDTSVAVPLPRLRPGGETTVSYPVPTAARGVVRVGPLRVVRADPLGLIFTVRSRGTGTRVWVYPRVHPLTAVPVGVVRSLDGQVDRVPHGSITFDSLRGYVPGDELRRVHWRTSARIGELMVREQVDTSLPRLVVLLDDRAAVHAGGAVGGTADSFEAACEAAASVIAAAVRAELPVALRLVGGAGAGGDGRRLGLTTTPSQLLDLLAEATLVDGRADRLTAAAARLRQRPGGDTLIFLTGVAGAEDLGPVAALRGRYPSIVVGVLGTTDAPEARHGVLMLAADTGEDFAAAWDAVSAW